MGEKKIGAVAKAESGNWVVVSPGLASHPFADDAW